MQVHAVAALVDPENEIPGMVISHRGQRRVPVRFRQHGIVDIAQQHFEQRPGLAGPPAQELRLLTAILNQSQGGVQALQGSMQAAVFCGVLLAKRRAFAEHLPRLEIVE